MKMWVVPALLAAAATVIPTAAHADVVARWQMNEGRGASVMGDSAAAGGANKGRIVSVRTGARGLVSGRSYRFNGATSYVRVRDSASLDPGNRRITLRATVRTVNRAMPDDSYDLVRKGYQTTRGGDWKMEIKRGRNHSVGRLHCVFKGVMPGGRSRTVKRVARVDIVDGRIHTVACRRTATAVHAVVDGRVFTNRRVSGHISNNQPVIVGAKTNGDDVLRGRLDEVRIAIG
ncbi:LamG-like jellyroll fold domain-containing protein [Nocardioides sp.]|uniref:LamG-like jellyroll fold domain-containing protein n=1 Tax=Nocardioides sp. TaxID=35761 RepID=UPI002ED236F3